MAKYQRFVAYVYEYQKGKKGNNCGFIKVEAREQVCLMEVHLRCPGLIAGMECTVYGFVRRKGLLEGSRIGKFRTEAGQNGLSSGNTDNGSRAWKDTAW